MLDALIATAEPSDLNKLLATIFTMSNDYIGYFRRRDRALSHHHAVGSHLSF